jgi:hypothetical protein
MRANDTHRSYFPHALFTVIQGLLGVLGVLGGSMFEYFGVVAVKAFQV